MSNTITRTPKPVITPEVEAVDVPVKVPAARPSLRRDLDETARILKEKQARIRKYKRNPAKNQAGEPMTMPLRFTIALTTATRRHADAVDKYDARYGKGAAKKALAKK